MEALQSGKRLGAFAAIALAVGQMSCSAETKAICLTVLGVAYLAQSAVVTLLKPKPAPEVKP